MKIAYLTHEEISRPSGVTNKMNGQIMQWKEKGIQTKLFSLKSSQSDSPVTESEILSVCTSKKFSRKYLAMARSVIQLHKKLSLFQPDIIYTRALLYVPNLISTLKHAAPYVVEINSNDVAELKTFSRVGHWYNLLTRDLFFKNAAAFVCVSQELSRIEPFAKYRKPTLVIGNGIDTQKYKSIPSTAPAEGPCRFVFIGTPGQSWHGIDKIGVLASALPEEHFTIIGLTPQELEKELRFTVPSNLEAIGYLDDHASSVAIASAHIGIGTLSLYAKGLEEASALKVRQYLALGLPVILGCQDTDLSSHSEPFILELPNTPDNISAHIEEIKRFSISARDIERTLIRDFAARVLDTRVKEKQRIDFLHSVISQTQKTNR